MSRSLSRVATCAVVSGRERIGRVRDIFFDDQAWTVRYLVVETGGLLRGRTVLLSAVSVRSIDFDRRVVEVDLTPDQVHKSPDVDTHRPVSRVHEMELHRYYQWPFYWGNSPAFAEGHAPTQPVISEVLAQEEDRVRNSLHEDSSTNLRSLREVTGYKVRTLDGTAGRLRDLLIRDRDWLVETVRVHLSTGGAATLIPTTWVKAFSWREKSCFLTVKEDRLRQGGTAGPR